MYSSQPVDRVDALMDGLDRNKIIQAFSILGIPIGDVNVNHRGEILDQLSIDELYSPKYWNDLRPAPRRVGGVSIYTPEHIHDESLGTPIEPKSDWDLENARQFL